MSRSISLPDLASLFFRIFAIIWGNFYMPFSTLAFALICVPFSIVVGTFGSSKCMLSKWKAHVFTKSHFRKNKNVRFVFLINFTFIVFCFVWLVWFRLVCLCGQFFFDFLWDTQRFVVFRWIHFSVVCLFHPSVFHMIFLPFCLLPNRSLLLRVLMVV